MQQKTVEEWIQLNEASIFFMGFVACIKLNASLKCYSTYYMSTHIFAIRNVWIVDDPSEVLICFWVMYLVFNNIQCVTALLWSVRKWKVLRVLMYFIQLQMQPSCIILVCTFQSGLCFVWNNCIFVSLCHCLSFYCPLHPHFSFIQPPYIITPLPLSKVDCCSCVIFIFRPCSRDDSVSIFSCKHENW